MITLTIIFLLHKDVLYFLAFDLQGKLLRKLELLGRFDIMFDPSGLCDGLKGLGWVIFNGVIVIDNGLQLID